MGVLKAVYAARFLFFSSRIRNKVAMAIYNGKSLDLIYCCHTAIFVIKFKETLCIQNVVSLKGNALNSYYMIRVSVKQTIAC